MDSRKRQFSPNAGSSQFRKGATVNSILRKIVCTGVHSQLVAITIPPGAETEEEAQGTSDQVVFVVEGAGKAILNGQVEVAGEHDAIFIPAGTVYKFKNSGASDLKIFVTCSPPVTADTVPQPTRRGRMNFYALAQSSPVDAKNSNVGLAFPGGIKWTTWKSPAVKNILFATDFSPASEAALPYAVGLARHYGSKLAVAHTIDPELYGLILPQTIERIESQVKEAAVTKIQALMRAKYGEAVQYEPAVTVGLVADALLDIIGTKSIDLVVLGTHGRRGLRKLVLGSVAEEVFRLAPCPVLTVGPKAEEGGSESGQFKQIVYPMELGNDVVKAAGYAISIAKEYAGELTFLNVIEEPSMSADEREWINVAAQHWFGDKIIPNLGLGARADLRQVFGEPATAILQCAAEKRADLVVMNIDGTQTGSPARMSGIAHRVVAGASCPVLTTR